MADKSITELVGVRDDVGVQPDDLFVLSQNGTAKKLSGQQLETWLCSFADGHGGIQTITYTAPVSPSLTGTMTITMADTTVATVPVTNGKGITSITWSESGTAGNGQTHTGTILYNDGTNQQFTIKDGVKGDQGNTWYVFIRYASQQPTSSSQMTTNPDNWMGIYCGTATTAPASYTDYSWFKIKGDKGDNGTPAVINNNVVEYTISNSNSNVPVSGWSLAMPTVTVENPYLWIRTTIDFNTGDPIQFYSVNRNGVDGQGAVSTVLGVSPDANGNVEFDATNILCTDNSTVQATLTGLASSISTQTSAITNNKPKHFSTTLTSLPATITDSSITSDMRVFNAYFAKPYAITGDLTFTTSNGSIVFSGTLSESTAFEFDLMKVR